MVYSAAQCKLCGDIVLALYPTQFVKCSCWSTGIAGTDSTSTVRYKSATPDTFRVELEAAPTSGVLPQGYTAFKKI
jgi:hypothetical protein